MRQCLFFFLTTLLLLFVFQSSSYAADFNIKLRKTDINELKQQLIPAIEQNILYWEELLGCLENGKKTDICLDGYSHRLDSKYAADSSIKNEEKEQTKHTILNKINDKNLNQAQLILALKKLLIDAKDIKQCVNKGKTANELTDCIIKP